MNSQLLIPIVDTAQNAARALIGALEILKSSLLVSSKTTTCEHIKRSDESTSGIKRWRCLDCGYIDEKEI